MLRKIVLHPFFLFPAFAILLVWPISFQVLTVKNDALSYYYPVRTLISDALNNGELPLWTPFINLGYPLHADLQSGAWNPVIWIFAFLTKYTLYGFHLELLLYIAFAGIGFYYLSRFVSTPKIPALVLGLAYMSSGFFIDSVQFFNCISAACYLPFIMLFFMRLIKFYKLADGLLLAIFLWLLITGGYPSIFIITIYSLVVMWIYFGITERHKIHFLKKTFLLFLVSTCTFIVLSLPSLISFYRHLPFIERGTAQSLSTVLENSMNPTTTLSLISPFSTTASDGFLESSILMRSIYLGIIPLIFITWGLTNRRTRLTGNFRFLLVMAVLMLGLAFGEHFFLRTAAYHFLPLMDSFRHPGLFRLFFIFFFLLAAAHPLSTWYKSKEQESFQMQRIIKYFLAGMILIALTIFALNARDIWLELAAKNSVLEKFYQLSFAGRFIIQLPILLLSISGFYWLLLKKKYILLPVIVALELLAVTQFNLPVTVVGSTSFQQMNNILNRNPTAFPLPNNLPIEESIAPYQKPNFISSPLHFEKIIGRIDVFVTPGNLLAQDSFYYSSERVGAFKKPVVYFRDSTEGGYTLNGIQSRSLSANRFSLQTNRTDSGQLVYQQNFYPGWKCLINGKEVEIKKVYKTEMLVVVPPGSSTVEFVYEPPGIKTAFVISSFCFLIVIIYVFFRSRRSVKPRLENETI